LRAILTQMRCPLSVLATDADGLDPATIPPGAEVVFVTPSHQCPTSATMPMARRQALLDRAEADDMLIVEDDYEFEMSFLKSPSPALKSLDRQGRVIHVGSFSKSIFPGLRLGWLVGPAPFIAQARALRALNLRHPPGHVQRTTAHFLALGHYDALIGRMNRAYAERRRVMEAAIHAHGLTIAGAGTSGGSSIWMEAPPGIDTTALAQGLRKDGVLIEPGAAFFAGATPPLRFFRLGYSSIPAGRIADGVGLIARAMAG
jgi:GntR family transcriptional regulator/MocR family aminotransferase